MASWRAAYAGLIPQHVLDDLSVDRREQMWREAASSGRSVLLIAAVPAGFLGFFSGGASRDEDADATGELYALYLRPEQWGTGLGGRLHDAGMTELARGFTEATLWVLDTNSRARAFYERQDWQPDGVTKTDTIGDAAVREIRYRRALS